MITARQLTDLRDVQKHLPVLVYLLKDNHVAPAFPIEVQ